MNFLNGVLEVLRAAQNSRDEKAKTPSLQRLQSKKGPGASTEANPQ
ncbi:hypothetical protein JC796_16160 [Delftia acidovorans]|nr:hypothetical protein [Delftia acidovorans]MBJ2142282.1 hypothetical protein [Delftia acidovorans]